MLARDRRRGWVVALSVLGLLSLSVIQLFHSETGPFDWHRCPACQSNKASLGVLQVPAPPIVPCFQLGTLAPETQVRVEASPATTRPSRAPPAV
ncbi:MAG: hypothetical protein FJY80_05495 [Candidatus Aminicenantes bacterium]|nr:hypothetical protein [Candidatus Aminicenantes bacterium]